MSGHTWLQKFSQVAVCRTEFRDACLRPVCGGHSWGFLRIGCLVASSVAKAMELAAIAVSQERVSRDFDIAFTGEEQHVICNALMKLEVDVEDFVVVEYVVGK